MRETVKSNDWLLTDDVKEVIATAARIPTSINVIKISRSVKPRELNVTELEGSAQRNNQQQKVHW